MLLIFNTVIVQEITLGHKISLACNYPISLACNYPISLACNYPIMRAIVGISLLGSLLGLIAEQKVVRKLHKMVYNFR